MSFWTRRIVSRLVLLLVFAIAALVIWAYSPAPKFEPISYSPIDPDDWPTDGWRTSTPEQQGMDSAKLVEMVQFYERSRQKDAELFIDSMTVVRNGRIVADIYPNPAYPRDEQHVIHSAVKSIVATLVGIAIDQGRIESVDSRVLQFFPDREIRNLDDRKRAMTVRDLLTMQTGMHSRDSYLYQYEGLFALQHSDDWLQFALDLPMATEPGTRFDYSNISTFLLSEIIRASTGQDTLDYAREHLFEPLGITDVKWEWNRDGQPIAWARMWLKPRDMAKIGLLYLQRGKWDGQQIVSADWIQSCVTPHGSPKNPVDILTADREKDYEATSRNFVGSRFIRPFADGYGYQWWLDRNGNYAAMGTNGQHIMVAPKENVVFVVTGKSKGAAQLFAGKLFDKFVLPSVKSDAVLPQNEVAQQALEAMSGSRQLAKQAIPVAILPKVATEISGSTYRLERNPFNTDNLRLTFPVDQDYAELSYTARESWDVSFQVGLDGIPRSTETNDSTFTAVGRWRSSDTFHVDVEIVGYSTLDAWEFHFRGDKVSVTEHSIAGEFNYTGNRIDVVSERDGQVRSTAFRRKQLGSVQ